MNFIIRKKSKKSVLSRVMLSIVMLLLVFPAGMQAKMQSSNYVIYETVMNPFDGPAISNVSRTSASTNATITWNTDVLSDGFVIYDTNSNFTSSKEQGNSAKNATSHSVELVGLAEETTYYFKVRSTRINGGETVDSTIRSFMTDTTSGSIQFVYSGGVLMVGKKETQPPAISDIKARSLSGGRLVVTWETSENATSFVEYGETSEYGQVNGQWDETINHSVTLVNLKPTTEYNFRAVSSDTSGNVSRSKDMTFETSFFESSISDTEINSEIKDIELKIEDQRDTGESKETILEETSSRIMDLIKKISPSAAPGTDASLFSQFDIIEKLSSMMPEPKMIGDPTVEPEANSAIISWTTDKEVNSLVAIAPEEFYDPNEDEPYIQITGNTENFIKEHRVRIFGLEPNTIYHFQTQSQGKIGPKAKSRDFTFRTKGESLKISNYYAQIINNETAVFKWVTNAEADTAVRFAPYRGGSLAIDEAKTFKDNAVSVIHEITIKDFQGGIFYEVELSSQDKEGNTAIETIPLFSTSADDLPPIISHVQTNSTIFLDKYGGIQTIISWRTNESSTSRVYYIEGVHRADKEWPGKTKLNNNYTKDHVTVITKFKPGTVYSFRVESIDSGGNASLSSVHTFMTPKKSESVFQIIFRILEETFSWIKKLV